MSRGKSGGAEDAEADEIHGEIESDDSEHSGDQAAREFAAWVAHFAGDERGGLPATVGEGDGNHRGADGADEAEAKGADRAAVRGWMCSAAEREAENNHRDDRGGFQQHEQALHVAAGARAETIDGGERRAERCAAIGPSPMLSR